MIVPRERVAVVIGNKGVVIQEIMRRTGTKVTINQKVEPNVAQISGKAEQNKSAKDLILRVIESGPGGLEDNSLGEIVSSTMECPQGIYIHRSPFTFQLHNFIFSHRLIFKITQITSCNQRELGE